MKHIKKAASYSMVGGLGLVVVAGLQGCGTEEAPQPPAPTQQGESLGQLENDLKEQNYFLVIEQISENPDKYERAERYPTEGATRAVLKKLDGQEQVLSNEELKQLAQAEADKVDAGTSELTKPANEAQASNGLGLGEMILASAAGALIGGLIANKLANNANARARTSASTRPSATVSSANNRARSAPKASAKPKSGFGGKSGSSSTSRTSSFGG